MSVYIIRLIDERAGEQSDQSVLDNPHDALNEYSAARDTSESSITVQLVLHSGNESDGTVRETIILSGKGKLE